MRQTPERSGLPLAARGPGAERLGLPSGVRGTPGVARLGHCAVSGASAAETTIKVASVLICDLPPGIITKLSGGRAGGLSITAQPQAVRGGAARRPLRRSADTAARPGLAAPRGFAA